MSATMTARFVADALMMAIWRRGKPEALLHHSDRGSQYLSEQFQRLMADHGIVWTTRVLPTSPGRHVVVELWKQGRLIYVRMGFPTREEAEAWIVPVDNEG